MAGPYTALFEDTVSINGQNLRDASLMHVMGNGVGAGARSGIRPGDPGLAVTLAGSTISVSVGIGIIHRVGRGVYTAVLPEVATRTLQAAHATFARIDLVYFRVWDTDVDASGLRKADIVYLPGTAAATPTVPAPGATEIYLPLAQITVPASGGGSASVDTSVRPVTVAPGGILPVSTTADLAAAGSYTGQYRHNLSTGVLERWSGSAWVSAQGTWTSYSPTWTASTTNPSLGTGGVLAGRYCLIGKLCTAAISFTAGSATTYGSGTWAFGLPLAAATPSGVDANFGWEGSSRAHSSTSWASGTAHIGAGGTILGLYDNAGAQWSAAKPFTWATGSAYHMQATVTYEVA